MAYDSSYDTRNIKDEYKGLSVEQIKSKLVLRDFEVATFNVDFLSNIAGICRLVNSFGGTQLNIIGRRKFDTRAAVGAHKYINLRFFETFEEFIRYIRHKELILVGVEDCDEAHNITKIPRYIERTCFLLGSESKGLSPTELNECAKIIKIPMIGTVRSLNVATVCGIVLYDWMIKNGNI